MANLLRANQELFRRTPDECFESLDALSAHCRSQRDQSQDHWEAPANLSAVVGMGDTLSDIVASTDWPRPDVQPT